jgi:4-hydroxy-tetrahydrodipicolinate synthase
MTCFTGIWVPLITPFRNGEIDIPALEVLTRELTDAGVSGLVVCGSTGEAAALSAEEQLLVLDTVLASARDCPVVMGLAGNNMAPLAGMQKKVQSRPIAGTLVPPPYYIRPSQAGLVEFFRTIADAASVPVIIYNIPYRTGVAIELETMRIIAGHERVVAIKDCGGDQAMTMNLIADGTLDVLAGEDLQIMATLCLGGTGAITAAAHIRPDLFVRLMQRVKSGDLAQARRIFYALLPTIQLLFAESNPAPLKKALSLSGMMTDELRTPMQPASKKITEQLRKELARLNDLLPGPVAACNAALPSLSKCH